MEQPPLPPLPPLDPLVLQQLDFHALGWPLPTPAPAPGAAGRAAPTGAGLAAPSNSSVAEGDGLTPTPEHWFPSEPLTPAVSSGPATRLDEYFRRPAPTPATVPAATQRLFLPGPPSPAFKLRMGRSSAVHASRTATPGTYRPAPNPRYAGATQRLRAFLLPFFKQWQPDASPVAAAPGEDDCDPVNVTVSWDTDAATSATLPPLSGRWLPAAPAPTALLHGGARPLVAEWCPRAAPHSDGDAAADPRDPEQFFLVAHQDDPRPRYTHPFSYVDGEPHFIHLWSAGSLRSPGQQPPHVALALRNDLAPLCAVRFPPCPLDTPARLGLYAAADTAGTLFLAVLPHPPDIPPLPPGSSPGPAPAASSSSSSSGRGPAVRLPRRCQTRHPGVLFSCLQWLVRNAPPPSATGPGPPQPAQVLLLAGTHCGSVHAYSVPADPGGSLTLLKRCHVCSGAPITCLAARTIWLGAEGDEAERLNLVVTAAATERQVLFFELETMHLGPLHDAPLMFPWVVNEAVFGPESPDLLFALQDGSLRLMPHHAITSAAAYLRPVSEAATRPTVWSAAACHALATVTDRAGHTGRLLRVGVGTNTGVLSVLQYPAALLTPEACRGSCEYCLNPVSDWQRCACSIPTGPPPDDLALLRLSQHPAGVGDVQSYTLHLRREMTASAKGDLWDPAVVHPPPTPEQRVAPPPSVAMQCVRFLPTTDPVLGQWLLCSTPCGLLVLLDVGARFPTQTEAGKPSVRAPHLQRSTLKKNAAKPSAGRGRGRPPAKPPLSPAPKRPRRGSPSSHADVCSFEGELD